MTPAGILGPTVREGDPILTNRWKLVAATLALALALAACSSDDNGGGGGGGGGVTGASEATGSAQTVSAEAYATALCSSMQTYIDDVTNLSNSFASTLDPSADLALQRDSVVGFLDDVLTITDTLISDLEAAGVPDVEGGQAIRDAVSQSFSQARTVIDDARSQVEGLSLDDPQAFATELGNIGGAIQDSLGGIGGSLSALDSPALSEAVAAEPACAQLSGAPGASGTT